jgi:hypothetical protein
MALDTVRLQNSEFIPFCALYCLITVSNTGSGGRVIADGISSELYAALFSDVSADESIEIEALDIGVATTSSGAVHVYINWLFSTECSLELVWSKN